MRRLAARVALLVLLLIACACPLPAVAGGRTIWLLQMPHERARKLSTKDPKQAPEEIRRRAADLLEKGVTDYPTTEDASAPPLLLPKGCIANSLSEFEQDPEFGKDMLGQKETFRTVAQFARQAEAKGFVVRLLFLPWPRALREIEQRYKEIVVAGGDVMITQVPSSWCSYLASRGILHDVSSVADRQQFRASTLRWYTWNDRLYAVPYIVDMRFLYYNKDKYSDADFGSREKFLAALEREKAKSAGSRGVPFVIPTAVGFDSFNLLANLFVDAGESRLVHQTSFFAFTWEQASLDSPAARSVVELLAEMRWRGLLDAAPLSADKAADGFLSGKCDMLVQGAWVAARYHEKARSFRLGIALPPDLGNGRRVFEGGSGYGICARNSIDPAAKQICEQFLRGQAAREPRNELPAAIALQEQSRLFQEVTTGANWSPDRSYTYPILSSWATAVEQQPIDGFFWPELNYITPTAALDNPAEQQRLHEAQASLKSRLHTLNDNINDQLTPGAMRRLGMPWSAVAVFLLLAAVFFTIAGLIRRAEKYRLEAAGKLEKIRRIEADAGRKAAEEQQIANQRAAGILAHRLRSILVDASASLGWVLGERYKAPERNKELLAEAKNALADAAAIIDRFRDYGKSQNYELNSCLAVEELLAKMLTTVKKAVRRDDIAIAVEAGPGLPFVRVNVDRLRDNFSNFAENAQRNEACHKIRLSAERVSEAEAAAVGLLAERRYVRLVCEDNGPGVPEPLKEKIFEPYYSQAADGNGLGLAMCRLDMQIHQGAVVERGEPGKGARFELFLPVVDKMGD